MERIAICRKTFLDEENRCYDLKYSMLLCSADGREFYGIEIAMRDSAGKVEKESSCGIFSCRADAEKFLRRLCAATALPVELGALCDDWISEREGLVAAS